MVEQGVWIGQINSTGSTANQLISQTLVRANNAPLTWVSY